MALVSQRKGVRTTVVGVGGGTLIF
jgi:hypothetical protein